MRAVSAGQVFVAPTMCTLIVERWRAAGTVPIEPPVVAVQPEPVVIVPPGGPLTGQERAVLVAVAAGYTSEEAARVLGVSTSTLQGHLHWVIGKLQVKDRTQAVAWAYPSRPVPGTGSVGGCHAHQLAVTRAPPQGFTTHTNSCGWPIGNRTNSCGGSRKNTRIRGRGESPGM